MIDFEKIFREEPKSKLYYSFQFSEINSTKKLFTRILEIYKLGAVILFGKNYTIKIEELNEKRLYILKQYMNSFGIEPKLFVYNSKFVNDIFFNLKSDVEKLFPLIECKIIEKNNCIENMTFSITPDEMEVLKKHIMNSELKNEYLNIFGINFSENKLSDFKYSTKVGSITYILRFDFII